MLHSHDCYSWGPIDSSSAELFNADNDFVSRPTPSANRGTSAGAPPAAVQLMPAAPGGYRPRYASPTPEANATPHRLPPAGAPDRDLRGEYAAMREESFGAEHPVGGAEHTRFTHHPYSWDDGAGGSTSGTVSFSGGCGSSVASCTSAPPAGSAVSDFLSDCAEADVLLIVAAAAAAHATASVAAAKQTHGVYPCKDFAKGVCRRGRGCRFAHVGASPREAQEAGVICKDFKRGKCARRHCRFVHAARPGAGEATTPPPQPLSKPDYAPGTPPPVPPQMVYCPTQGGMAPPSSAGYGSYMA